MRDRNKCQNDPPECPMGSDGPLLTDDMIEFTCKLVGRMIEAVHRHQRIEIGYMDGEGDIHAKAFGGITYVFAMAKYIKEFEDEYAKCPFIGIDPEKLQGVKIAKMTSDEVHLEDGRSLKREGMTWRWSVELPDPW